MEEMAKMVNMSHTRKNSSKWRKRVALVRMVSRDATITLSKNYPTNGENVVIIFVT